MKVRLLVGLLVGTVLAYTVTLVAQEPASAGANDPDRRFQRAPVSNVQTMPPTWQSSRDNRGNNVPGVYPGVYTFPQATPNPTQQAQVEFAAAKTEEERIAAKEKLEEALSKEFDADIARRETELEKIRNQLAKLAESLQKRIDAKSKIVALRAQVLTAESEGLEWRSSSPVPEGSSAPFYSGTAHRVQVVPYPNNFSPAGPNPRSNPQPASNNTPSPYGPVFESPASRDKE